MSTGSEYQAPVRSRSQTRVYVTRRRDGTRSPVPRAHRGTAHAGTGHGEAGQFSAVQTNHRVETGSTASGYDGRQHAPGNGRATRARAQAETTYRAAGYQGARRYNPAYTSTSNASASGSAIAATRSGVPRTEDAGTRDAAAQRRAGEPGPGAGHQLLRTVPEATSVSRQPAETDRSISGYPASSERESEAATALPAHSEEAANEASRHGENMVNDDPRNPFKSHRNSVFYNMYPTRGRSVARTQRPPGTGYGTRYFQNGKNLTKIHARPVWVINGLVEVERKSIYNLFTFPSFPFPSRFNWSKSMEIPKTGPTGMLNWGGLFCPDSETKFYCINTFTLDIRIN